MTVPQEAAGSPSPNPDVIVVGAGFAGVAAATALAEKGARVMVLETRQRPGGRAYSWTDPATAEIFDNGQHVLASFYDETLRLLDRLGTSGALERSGKLKRIPGIADESSGPVAHAWMVPGSVKVKRKTSRSSG